MNPPFFFAITEGETGKILFLGRMTDPGWGDLIRVFVKRGAIVAKVKCVSGIRVEPVEGKVRRAHLLGEGEPVLFGVHSEVA